MQPNNCTGFTMIYDLYIRLNGPILTNDSLRFSGLSKGPVEKSQFTKSKNSTWQIYKPKI